MQFLPLFVSGLYAPPIPMGAFVAMMDQSDEGREILGYMQRSSPNSMVCGDVHGVAPFFYQSVAHRPTPDLGQLTVPGVERLYLVGPFMHPGGGVYGAGRATAMRMFGDLKLNFDKVAGARV